MGGFQEFLKKAQQDPQLQKELRERFGDPAAGVPWKELTEFASARGYHFTIEETRSELSDDQLGSVSGGLAVGKFDRLASKDVDKLVVKLHSFDRGLI